MYSWSARKQLDVLADASGYCQAQPPVNKFPQFVSLVVRSLKRLSPAMGKVKIAQTLARAGLHLGTTTVGRMARKTGVRACCWCRTGAKTSCGNFIISANGTTVSARTRRWASKRPTRYIMPSNPQTAARDSSPARAGLGARHVRGLGPWCGANPARGWNWKSRSIAGENTCQS